MFTLIPPVARYYLFVLQFTSEHFHLNLSVSLPILCVIIYSSASLFLLVSLSWEHSWDTLSACKIKADSISWLVWVTFDYFLTFSFWLGLFNTMCPPCLLSCSVCLTPCSPAFVFALMFTLGKDVLPVVYSWCCRKEFFFSVAVVKARRTFSHVRFTISPVCSIPNMADKYFIQPWCSSILWCSGYTHTDTHAYVQYPPCLKCRAIRSHSDSNMLMDVNLTRPILSITAETHRFKIHEYQIFEDRLKM